MNVHFSPEYFRHERSSLLENVGGDVEGREQELRLDVLVNVMKSLRRNNN